jgi:D-3-phosphoglycerate dehydrogenase
VKILVAESAGFAPGAAEVLRGIGELTLADVDRAGLVAGVRDHDVLWVRLRHQVDTDVMDAGTRLRVIVTPTTGLNHIDVDEAQRRGIVVLSLRGETDFLRNVVATAEHTLALMLALLRRVPAARDHVNGGGWDRDRFKGHEVHGKTVGIIGFGRLGKIVAKYVAALGAEVLVTDPVTPQEVDSDAVTVVSIDELLVRADVVTLHVNHTADNDRFFGRSQFARMKRGAWFVNTARGELLDEEALLECLESGHLAGAALDVLRAETSGRLDRRPLVQYARDHDNLIITPHIGGATIESMEKTECFLADRLRELVESMRVFSVPQPDLARGEESVSTALRARPGR